MIDPRHIGHTLPPYAVDVEKGRLKFFAKAIGQTDPVYSDEATAKAAGHPSLPVPPTFLFCMEMDSPNPGALRDGRYAVLQVQTGHIEAELKQMKNISAGDGRS